MNHVLKLACALAVAVTAPAQQSTQDADQTNPQVVLPEPSPFAVQLEVSEDEVRTARVAANRNFLGVLVASLEGKTVSFPGLPAILAAPVVIGCGLGAAEHTFTLGRIPEGIVVHLQGLGLSESFEIGVSRIEKAAAQ